MFRTAQARSGGDAPEAGSETDAPLLSPASTRSKAEAPPEGGASEVLYGRFPAYMHYLSCAATAGFRSLHFPLKK